MLNRKQMHAAHFAHEIDHDPDLAYIDDAHERVRAWCRETNLDEPYYIRKYDTGREILDRYAIHYTDPYLVDDAPPTIALDTPHLTILAGEINGEQAAQIASFMPL